MIIPIGFGATMLRPSLLPNGEAVLFTILANRGTDNQIAVLDLATGLVKTLIRGGTNAEYVSSGHLVYAAAGSLRAVRFDPERLEVIGNPVPVVERVRQKPLTGAADFTVSRNGTLVYVPDAVASPQRSLVWVGRDGREEPISAPPRAYQFPRLSPDGNRIALDIRDQQNDIWILDITTQALTRLTDHPGADSNPVWSPKMAGGPPEHAALAAVVIGLLFPALRGGFCRVYDADLRVRTPSGLCRREKGPSTGRGEGLTWD